MLRDNIRKKVELLDNATNVFLDKITKVERRIFRLIKKLLESFSSTDGNFSRGRANQRKLLSLDKKILKIIADAKLSDEVAVFLKNFDKVDRLNRLIYEGYLDDGDINRLARLSFDDTKLFIVDDITRALTSTDMIRANVVKPIRDVLLEAIRFERPIKDIEKMLRSTIVTSEGSNSRILRYTRQISQDALNQFDGALNDGIRDELGLDGFFYLGSVVRTTRQNCFDMVRGVGKYEELAIRPGVYRVEDIPKIIRKARTCEIHHSSGKKDCGSGFNDNVTPETFARYRMGYGCRHAVSYFRLLDDDVPKGLRDAVK